MGIYKGDMGNFKNYPYNEPPNAPTGNTQQADNINANDKERIMADMIKKSDFRIQTAIDMLTFDILNFESQLLANKAERKRLRLTIKILEHRLTALSQ